MIEARPRPSVAIRRLRWIHLAPVFAFVALAAWAFASPIGAGPDDDYHLTSTWCAVGGGEHCEDGADAKTRVVSEPLTTVACYAGDRAESAACQDPLLERWETATVETDRGNFRGEYPPVYYTLMHLFAGPDLQVSALAMRLLSAALFVALATALAVLLPAERRPTLLWGWLVTLVPLGIFLIPSNNPSGWALTGVGTTFLALAGWYESTGRRRVALAALVGVGALMAAGSRGDAAVYVTGAVITATLIAGPWRSIPWRSWGRWLWLPAIGILIGLVFFATATQSSVAVGGFVNEVGPPAGIEGEKPTGFALAIHNLFELPLLWTGVWGSWPLGWLDTGMPDVVPWAATAAFVVVGFAGLRRLDWGKALAVGGVLLVLVVLPVWVLTRGDNIVGENLQPRYLLPLIVLFAFVLLWMPGRNQLTLTRLQAAIVLGALAIANLVALQIDIRRYVTGADQPGLNLDAGAEWWWTGFPVGPTGVWIAGALAFAGLLAVLWRELRVSEPQSAAVRDVTAASL